MCDYCVLFQNFGSCILKNHPLPKIESFNTMLILLVFELNSEYLGII